MRKLLVAVIAAAALFAVGAFAASFTVESEDVASGEDAVERCATNVAIEFDETFDGVVTDNWNISTITATFTGGDPASCVGLPATLILQNDTNGIVFQETANVAVGATATFTVPGENSPTGAPNPLTVSDVFHASILVDGTPIDTSL